MTGAALTESAASAGRGRLAPRSVAGGFQGSYLVGLIALIAAYYAAAQLGLALQFAGPVAAVVWLPAGVGMAFLFLAGLRFWPGLVIGDLLVNNYSALPVGSALGQTCGNLLEVLLTVVLLHRIASRRSLLVTVPGTAGVVAAIAAGCAISATIGSLSLGLGDVIQGRSLPEIWRTWWLGDFTGALIVLPTALALMSRPLRAWSPARLLEGSVLLAILVLLSLIGINSSEPLSYIVFPAVIWAALRFGPRGATLAITIMSGFAIRDATHYAGAFTFHSISRSLLNTQLYIAVATLSALCLAAVVSEREVLATRLRRSRSRLVVAADTERQRIERNLHDGAQQRLIALGAHLTLAASESRRAPAHAGPLFESAKAELDLAIDELRHLAHGLCPPVLSRFGLESAINLAVSSSELQIDVVDSIATRLDDRAESTAYFLVMEAIANARKHARASRIELSLALRPGNLEVSVSDDGVGGAGEQPGLGLEGLRDRVEAIGGRFEIDSEPACGTRISAAIPCSPRMPDARRRLSPDAEANRDGRLSAASP